MRNQWTIDEDVSTVIGSHNLLLEKSREILETFTINKNNILIECIEEVFGTEYDLNDIVDFIKCESYPDKEVYFIHDTAVAEFYKIEYDFDEETNTMNTSMKWRKL